MKSNFVYNDKKPKSPHKPARENQFMKFRFGELTIHKKLQIRFLIFFPFVNFRPSTSFTNFKALL